MAATSEPIQKQRLQLLRTCYVADKFFGKWILAACAFFILTGALSCYVGYQRDMAYMPIQTQVALGRAVSGSDNPIRDAITDARFAKEAEQAGSDWATGVFFIFFGVTIAIGRVLLAKKSKEYAAVVCAAENQQKSAA